jgi:hypothetical protein
MGWLKALSYAVTAVKVIKAVIDALKEAKTASPEVNADPVQALATIAADPVALRQSLVHGIGVVRAKD